MPVRSSYLPPTHAGQVAWANTFASVVGVASAVYGVPAASMAAFAQANTELQAAWGVINLPESRTRVTVNDFRQKLAAMKALAKGLVSVIQGTPTVTSQMLLAAGLTVRKTRPTRRPIPQARPYVLLKRVDGRTATFELRQDAGRRGKPADVAGATLFLAGPVADGEGRPGLDEFRFATGTTRTTVEWTFPPSATGDTYYVTAFWRNARDESGPAAEAVRVNLPAGGLQLTEAAATTRRQAA